MAGIAGTSPILVLGMFIMLFAIPLLYMGIRNERSLIQTHVRLLRSDLENWESTMDLNLKSAIETVVNKNTIDNTEVMKQLFKKLDETTADLKNVKQVSVQMSEELKQLKEVLLSLPSSLQRREAGTSAQVNNENPVDCDKCPAQLPQRAKGTLGQHVFNVNRNEPLPLISPDEHPWRAEGGGASVQIFGTDASIDQGDLKHCDKLDVFFHQLSTQHGMKRCLMMVPHRSIKTHLLSLEKNSSGAFNHEHATRWAGEHLLRGGHLESRNDLLGKYFGGFSDMIQRLRVLTGIRTSGSGPTLLVMATNEGHMPLLLNFACSLRKTGIAMPPHVVFVSSAALETRLLKLGFKAFYHNALGTFPTGPAAVYGDRKFGSMMFMKQFSVHLTLELGRDVLFQDLDVTWLKNPIEDLGKSADKYFVQIQDDGARNERFQPYFANSGFFYLKNNDVVRTLWDQVTMVLHPFNQGNQATLNVMMQTFVQRRDLTVRVLPKETYVSGSIISHPHFLKGNDQKIPLHESAEIMHFCWTHNVTHKFHKMQLYDQLFISELCFHDNDKCKTESLDDICVL